MNTMDGVKVIMPVGVIGSGKTEYGKKLAADDSSVMIISGDGFREMLFGKYCYKPPYEPIIDMLVRNAIVELLVQGCSVYYDETNLTVKKRQWFMNEISKKLKNVRYEAVYFIPDVQYLTNRIQKPRTLSAAMWTEVYIEQIQFIEQPTIYEGFSVVVNIYSGEVEKKTPYEEQVEYCVKNNVPVLMPYEVCSACGVSLSFFIKDNAAVKHITSCPHCHTSFC